MLHRTSYQELAEAAGESIAGYLLAARTGELELETGGGGKYGKVKTE